MGHAVDSSARSTRAVLLALCSSLVILVLTARVPQGLYADPAEQLTALSQGAEGRSGSINEIVSPDPTDLARDSRRWISWWAPGTQLVAYPLVRGGVSIGRAVRVVAIACLVLGAVGWARWFAQFELPKTLLLGLAAAFPWMRYASNSLFLYSAEALVFAAAPWLLLVSLGLARAAGTPQRTLRLLAHSAVVGALLGCSYVLKYSALLPAAGMLLFVVIALVGPAVPNGLFGAAVSRPVCSGLRAPFIGAARLSAALLCAVSMAIPIGVLSVLNRSRSAAANLVTASAGANVSWEHLARGLLNPVLAVADAEAGLNYVLFHPSHPIFASDRVLMLAALPGAAVLYWLLGWGLRGAAQEWRRGFRTDGGPREASVGLLSVCCFASSVAALVLIWCMSRGASYEARHMAAGSFALLPLLLHLGVRRWRTGGAGPRSALTVAGTAYVALPLAYGALSVAGKAARPGSSYRVATAQVANPLLAPRDLATCVAAATAGFDTTRDVWYLPEFTSALDLPGRALMVNADFTELDALRGQRYRSSRPTHVRLLLPPHFERSERGAVIRASFGEGARWTRTELPACTYLAWDATIAGDMGRPWSPGSGAASR